MSKWLLVAAMVALLACSKDETFIGNRGLGQRGDRSAALGACRLDERRVGRLGRRSSGASARLPERLDRNGLLRQAVRDKGKRADDGCEVDQDGR